MRHFRFLYIFEILSKEKENTINLVNDIEGKTNLYIFRDPLVFFAVTIQLRKAKDLMVGAYWCWVEKSGAKGFSEGDLI